MVYWEGKRPILAPGLRLHRGPVRSYLLREAQHSSPRPSLLATLNRDAAELLHHCDGAADTETIVRLVKRLGRPFSLEKTCRFLARAHKLGHVNVEPSPGMAPQPQHTGSFDNFVPAHGSIEVTHDCNLKCVYCYHGDSAPSGPSCPKPLEFEQLRETLLAWKRLGLLSLEITGGEPALAPHLADLIEFCGRHFCLIAVLSNGMLLNKPSIAALARARDHVCLSISLDAADPRQFARISGGKARDHHNVVATLRQLAAAGVWFNVAMTVTPESINEIVPTAILAKKFGASGFSSVPPQPFGRAANLGWRWTVDHQNRFLQRMQEVDTMFPKFVSNLLTAEQMERRGGGEECGMAKRSAVLSPSGTIRGCLMMPEFWSVGSVRETPLEEIFFGPAYQGLARLSFPAGRHCQGCRYGPLCRGCLLRPMAAVEREGRGCGWLSGSGVRQWLRENSATELPPAPTSGPAVFEISPEPSRETLARECGCHRGPDKTGE